MTTQPSCSAAADAADLYAVAAAFSVATAVILSLVAIRRVSRLLHSILFAPWDYKAAAGHLLERAATKRGRVTRNLPRGAADAKREDAKSCGGGFPNGWFFVEESANLARGNVRQVRMLGLELAVFRDERGDVYAVDAYCPHLGANMAIGGHVAGDCIECPFHGWQFRGSDGRCQLIPGAKRVPELARVRSWRVLEKNASIFLWHHIDDKEPDWYPEDVEECATGGFNQKCGRTEHVVYSCIQDIPENGADLGHFEPVHKQSAWLGSDVREVSKRICSGTSLSTLVWHDWEVVSAWKPLPAPDGHVGVMQVAQRLFFGSRMVPLSKVTASVSQIGPGIVYLRLKSNSFGDLLLCQYVIPEEPQRQRLVHVMYSRPGILPRLFGKLALVSERTMVERDIQIWNNKCDRPKPVFAATTADESLVKFRRWFSQFYSSIASGSASQEQKVPSTKASCSDW